MKAFFDFFPVLAFFLAYFLFGQDIYLATKVIMVAVAIQVTILLIKDRTLGQSHLISAVLIVIFGGVTLILQNDLFIKWKPTVANWLFAAAFFLSQFIGEKPLVQRMLQASVSLERPLWVRLNMSWVIFFTIAGALNLYVVYNYDEETWVKFKLFGLIGLSFLFIIGQGIWLAQKMPREEDV